MSSTGQIFAVLGLGLSVLASGCAGLRNTPAQDLAYERWRRCEVRVPGLQIQQVDGDGRIWFMHLGAWDRAAMLECLREAGRDGPSLPEPRPILQPRGAGESLRRAAQASGDFSA